MNIKVYHHFLIFVLTLSVLDDGTLWLNENPFQFFYHRSKVHGGTVKGNNLQNKAIVRFLAVSSGLDPQPDYKLPSW